MHDDDIFAAATRAEDWTHLAGTGAAARAKSTVLRRNRYAGIAGATAATAAVAVGVVAIAGTFGGGSAPFTPRPAAPTSASGAAGPAHPASSTSQAPAKGTMGALYEEWKSCPDSELRAAPAIQQRWRDACHRYMATLTALLPGYDVSPAVSDLEVPKGVRPKDTLRLDSFKAPSFVIPAGYTPHMGTALYRIVDKDGATTEAVIRAVGRVDGSKPGTGESVTLPNGLKAWLTLGTDLGPGEPGYEIYLVDQGKTFYMFTSGAQPDFDFKSLVMSPQFADMVAKALADPEG